MYCSQCGKIIPDQSQYCQECGALQKGKIKIIRKKGIRNKKMWYIMIPVFIVLCGVGIGILVFCLMNTTKTDEGSSSIVLTRQTTQSSNQETNAYQKYDEKLRKYKTCRHWIPLQAHFKVWF